MRTDYITTARVIHELERLAETRINSELSFPANDGVKPPFDELPFSEKEVITIAIRSYLDNGYVVPAAYVGDADVFRTVVDALR